MHLSERHGRTIELLAKDGIRVSREIDYLSTQPAPGADAARALLLVDEALREEHPDMILLVGDRTETIAAGMAATINRVPIVHLHGGEESEGAIDNAIRHALTKLAHLHLVSHEEHARRVRQMGEEPTNVVVVGPPGLDNAQRSDLLGRDQVLTEIGEILPDPLVLVTYHPTTLGEEPLQEVQALAAGLDDVPASYVITQPNTDQGGATIADFWQKWVRKRRRTILVDSLGDRCYWSLLRYASAVVGNSSSGIIEAPAVGIPVVNVGDRQKGRLRFGPVHDVPAQSAAIATALRQALALENESPRKGVRCDRELVAPRIVEALAQWGPPKPPRKRFHDFQ